MVAISAQQAYNDIAAWIQKQGGAAQDWYCGITSNLDTRLFSEHHVPRENHWRIARQCHSESDARAVEEAILKLGCKGGPGGGDEKSVFVYAYLMATFTNP